MLKNLTCLTFLLFSMALHAMASDETYERSPLPRKRTSPEPLEKLALQPTAKSPKEDLTPPTAVAGAQQKPLIVKISIPRDQRAAGPIPKPTFPLLALTNDILRHLIANFITSDRDLASLDQTCHRLNDLVRLVPFAPAHFEAVVLRAVQPRLRPSIPLADFMTQMRLDTRQGRQDFVRTFTVPGFVARVAADPHKGYFLGQAYLDAKQATQKRLTEYRQNGTTTELRLAGGFSIFPPEFVELTYLKLIHFQNGNIDALPAKIEQLSLLEELICSNGFIRHIPEGIGNLRYLRILNLGNNYIPELPACMSKLRALTELNLENNLLREFPTCLLALTNLTSLNLAHNRIPELPRDISVLRKLRILNFSNETPTNVNAEKEKEKGTVCYMTDLPFEFGNMPSLEHLILAGHNLEELPHSFRRLSALQHLDLSSNNINTFPEELLSLRRLEYLDVRNTLIDSLPVELTRLDNLNHLNIRGTAITEVPPEVRQMPQLTQLIQDPKLL